MQPTPLVTPSSTTTSDAACGASARDAGGAEETEAACAARDSELDHVAAMHAVAARGIDLGRGPPAAPRHRPSVEEGWGTVVWVDIKGFTAGCARMPAQAVGAWVADFYARVQRAAAPHGVRRVEIRGDCCICVARAPRPSDSDSPAGADGRSGGIVPGRADWTGAAGGPGGGRGGDAVRALAFAADLHAELATSAAGGQRGMAVRMGAASGPIAFLCHGDPKIPGEGGGGRGRGAAGVRSVEGPAVRMAAGMEELGAEGVVVVHRSAADRWAAQAAAAAPRTACVAVKGHGLQRAAVFDCAGRAFVSAAAGLLPEAAMRSLGH